MKNKIFIKRIPLLIPRDYARFGQKIFFPRDAILDNSVICSIKVLTTQDAESLTYGPNNTPVLLNPRTLGGCSLTLKSANDTLSVFNQVSLASFTRQSNYDASGLPTNLNLKLSDSFVQVGDQITTETVIMFEFSYYRI